MTSGVLRVAFLGNDPWSVPPLRALVASRHPVVLVATSIPRPAGRGSKPRPTAVAEAARELGIDPVEVETVRVEPGLTRLRDTSPDVLVVVAYGELLTPEVLAVASRETVNLHFSLLPHLRGAAPVQHALLRGDHETGVTTMRIDAGLDTGPILGQRVTEIGPGEDAGALGLRLATIGGDLLTETLDRLADGHLEVRPQDDAAATWAPKLGAADRDLDWSRPAEELLRRVRALSPSPGATTRLGHRRLLVFAASPADLEAGAGGPTTPPGTLIVDRDGDPIVAAGQGALALLEVGPEGRRRMSGADFVRGARLDPGARLG